MTNSNIEEKSPLLFVLDGNDDISKAEKAYFDANRFRGITHGATAVFTHFPNFIGTYWILTALFGLTFFMIILLLLSSIAAAGLRVPRCVAAQDAATNATIHLVHIHRPHEQHAKETKLVEEIIEKYPSYSIHVISVRDESTTTPFQKTTKSTTTSTTSTNLPTLIRQKRKIDETRFGPFNINVEAKRLIDMLLRGKMDDKYESRKARSVSPEEKSKTTTLPTTTTTQPIGNFDDLASTHPNNIRLENLTYQQAFSFTPLHHYWQHLDEDLRVFGIRVLQLWQFGGISFDLRAPRGEMKNNLAAEKRVKSFVLSEKLDYGKLPVGVVEVDEEGLHMESKVPCHVFFGEIVMNLRRAGAHSTVRDVMRKSIKVFCKHFSASKKYCGAFNNE